MIQCRQSIKLYFAARANKIDTFMMAMFSIAVVCRVTGHYFLFHFLFSINIAVVSVRLLELLSAFDHQLAILLSVTRKVRGAPACVHLSRGRALSACLSPAADASQRRLPLFEGAAIFHLRLRDDSLSFFSRCWYRA